jgi:hypothetical protein
MSGFRLRALCGRSRASAGRLRPIGLAALATCIILLSSFGSALAQQTFITLVGSPSGTVASNQPIQLTATVQPQTGGPPLVSSVSITMRPLFSLAAHLLHPPVRTGRACYRASYFRSALTSSMQSMRTLEPLLVTPATCYFTKSPGRLLSPKVLVPPQSFPTDFQRSQSRSAIPLQWRRTG